MNPAESAHLKSLLEHRHAGVKKLARALDAAFRGETDPQERAWTEKIDALRSALATSSAVLTKIDYGAGNPGSCRTPQEMFRGVRTEAVVSEIYRSSKSALWATVLLKIVRGFGPDRCVELGTCLGVSAAYQAAALKMNGRGSLVTLEGAPALAAASRENLRLLGLEEVRVVEGRFQDNLENVLAEREPVDYAFIDGHHDEEATFRYFDAFVPRLSKNAVLVFDDISWSPGMRRAWDKIAADPRVTVSLDMGSMGACLFTDATKTSLTLSPAKSA